MLLNNPRSFSQLIRIHRKKSGLSQRELAIRAGVGKTIIFDLEHERMSVRLDLVLKVISILGIKLFIEGPFVNQLEKSNDPQS